MKRIDKVLPLYSRSMVKKAGDILISETSTADEKLEALDILNNWRAVHSYPVNTFQAYLRLKIKSHKFRKYIVVQRIKRIPSIIGKLSRNPKMQLSRMHDIGGLRAILSSCEEIDILVDDFKKSKFKHILVDTYDYIKEPKDSGYRSVHLVYKYSNRQAPEYEKLRVEIQLRTFLQHSWATAVETMGTFLDHSLKSSEGPQAWLDFFEKVGSAFAYLENKPFSDRMKNKSIEELSKEIIAAEKTLDVRKRLRMFGSSIKIITDQNLKLKYYIIHLKTAKNEVRYKGFHAKDYELATKEYLEIERTLGEQKDEQVVLVSGDSFKALKSAYPNYFLDTHDFINQLKRILNIQTQNNSA